MSDQDKPELVYVTTALLDPRHSVALPRTDADFSLSRLRPFVLMDVDIGMSWGNADDHKE